ncbi:MAG: hypothetical protein ACE5KI_00670 [Dehalococcoidia bacterium]
MLVVAFLALTGPACFRSSATPELTIGEGVPFDAQNVTYVDLEALRGDADLAFVANSIESVLAPDLGTLMVEASGFTTLITFVLDGERSMVAQGGIVESELREYVSNLGYLVEEVGGKEVWSGPGVIGSIGLLGSGRIAMSSGIFEAGTIVSELEEKRDPGLPEQMGILIDELPAGTIMSLSRNCLFAAEGCQAIGISFNKKDAQLSSFTLVALFADESAARAARNDLEALFTGLSGSFSEVQTQVVENRFLASGDALSAVIFEELYTEFDFSP